MLLLAQNSTGTDWPVRAEATVGPPMLVHRLGNHHHMFPVTERINGTILWTNLHLLFW